jgi:uncharacterized delta-60 repeat protein
MSTRTVLSTLLLVSLAGCGAQDGAVAVPLSTADVTTAGPLGFMPQTPAAPGGSGTLDATFGDAGKRSLEADVAAPWAAAIDEKGRIVLAGSEAGQAVVKRLEASGVTDTSFGDAGTVRIGDGAARSVALAGDAILVAGTAGNGDGFVARLDLSGARDPSFAGVTSPGVRFERVLALPDGSLIAAGESGGDIAIERIDAAGAPLGRATADLGGDDVLRALVRLPDGRLLAGGSAGNDFAVARLTADGKLDSSFGTGGVSASFPGRAESVAALADGRFVAAGSDFLVARYSADGRLDPTFGGTGVVRGSGWLGVAHDVFPLADGGLTVLGSGDPGDYGPDSDLVLTRLLPDGSIDYGFAGGSLSVDFEHRRETASQLVSTGDGRALLLGLSEHEDSAPRIALARCWL